MDRLFQASWGTLSFERSIVDFSEPVALAGQLWYLTARLPTS
jgi:hypothetical protein